MQRSISSTYIAIDSSQQSVVNQNKAYSWLCTLYTWDAQNSFSCIF